MPASVIGERVGWPYSERTLRQNVARIRPEYAPRRLDPADRLEWEIGDVAQCDLWFPNVDIPIGNGKTARFPVLTMILAWSKYPVALMIPCHRVIQQNGKLGGYHWGETRKQAIHAWEAARYE